MSKLVHTYFVPRGLSSFAPSYDCWRGFFEVPPGTADNSPPFLTVGCPHHKTLPVPRPRDERIPGPIVPSRFLPSTGRTLQRLRFMAHELRSGFARWDFFRPWRDLFRCLPQPTVKTVGYYRLSLRDFRRPFVPQRFREQIMREYIHLNSTPYPNPLPLGREFPQIRVSCF